MDTDRLARALFGLQDGPYLPTVHRNLDTWDTLVLSARTIENQGVINRWHERARILVTLLEGP